MVFKRYESDLVKRLVKKFGELKIESFDSVVASIFCKVIFLLQEDNWDLQIEKKGIGKRRSTKQQNEAYDQTGRNARSVSPMRTPVAKKNAGTNKDLNKALEAEKSIFLKTSGTLGRGALREENEYLKMFTLEQRDPSQLMVQDKRVLMKGRRILIGRSR